MATQQRLAETAAIASNQFELISQGRNGNPYWPVNWNGEKLKVSDQSVVDTYRSPVYSTINPAFRDDVLRTVLRNYQMTTRAPQNALDCPYQGLQAALNGQTSDVFGALDAFIKYPACNPYEATVISQNILYGNIAAAQNEWVTRLNWGNGIYDVKDANGNVTVPGIFLNAIGTQSVTSGFRQLENADDIGQMVGSFFKGIGSKLLSGPQSIASVQSYYNQAVQQQVGSLATSVINTALTNLNQILNWEQAYNDAQQQMASAVTSSVIQLRTAENRCWQLIVQNVCDSSPTSSASSTCTGKSGGGTLTIATSTAFSNAVIKAGNFAPLATSLKDRIDISNQNLVTIGTLINNVQSSDPATRNTALQQLEAIAQSNVLHTQANVNQAQDELSRLRATLSDTSTGLVATAIHRWAGDDTSGGTGTIAWNGDLTSDVGWCNINKTQTLDNWTTKWTQ